MKEPLAGDPVVALISEIVSVVESSRWTFVRFDGTHVSEMLSSQHGEYAEMEAGALLREFKLQQAHTAKGPRLSPTLGPLEAPYVSGITMVFADLRREFGMLQLLRTDDAGPFTSLEIQALTLALDASVDRLSGFTTAQTLVPWVSSLAIDRPVMHVLDIDLNVVLTWDAGVKAVRARRLPVAIEKTVRGLLTDWTDDPATHASGVGQPVSFITVRTQPLSGKDGSFVGVLLDRAPGSQIFDTAARAYSLSTRELETLAMLLRGAKLDEIATALNITNSTVQDHIRSMLEKTASRNRSEMIGKLLHPRRGE